MADADGCTVVGFSDDGLFAASWDTMINNVNNLIESQEGFITNLNVWTGAAQTVLPQGYTSDLSDQGKIQVTATFEDDFGVDYAEPDAPDETGLKPFDTNDGAGIDWDRIVEFTMENLVPVSATFDPVPTKDYERPNLSFPTAPEDLDATPPSENDQPTVTDPTLPAALTLDEYSLNELFKITVPTEPTLTERTFTGVAPTVDFSVPSPNFNYTEPTYTTANLTALQAKILEIMAGGTGIPTAIWEMIWDGARKNLELQARRLEEEIYNDAGDRGFSLPVGVHDKKLKEAKFQIVMDQNALRREIGVEYARQEFQALQFSVSQGIALEQIVIALFNSQQQRLLDAERIGIDVVIQVFNSNVQLFNSRQNLYRTEADVFRTLIEADLKELEEYRVVLEGKRILGELNAQEIAAFKEKWETNRIRITNYAEQVRAAGLQVDVDRAKLERFAQTIQIYVERWRAKAVEADVYATTMGGEKTKMDIYAIDSSNFVSELQAHKLGVDSTVAEAGVDLENEKLKIERFTAHTEKMGQQLDAQKAKMNALTNYFGNRAEVFRSKISGQDINLRNELDQARAGFEKARINSGIALDQQKSNLDARVSLMQLYEQRMVELSRLLIQIEQAAFASYDIHSSITESASNSRSCETRHNYNRTQ